jgi:hypothetical protein
MIMTTADEWDAWNYRPGVGRDDDQPDLVGFEVHATDGSIGKVDEATSAVDSSEIVVDTGPWIFGRRVLLPAGTIERIDWDAEEVHVDLTKDQIKHSPELPDDAVAADSDYRLTLGGYYGGFYGPRRL